jgi:hypothetical protein
MLAQEAGFLFPGKTAHRQHEAVRAGQILQVAHLHHRVLHMGGNDVEILLVERDQLEAVHACFAPAKGCPEPFC